MAGAPIRTITLGIEEAHPLKRDVIERAARLLQSAQSRYTDAGYEVQTVRLSTRSLFEDTVGWSNEQILAYVQELQHMLDDAGISFCSLGTAHAARTIFPLERIDLLTDIIASTQAVSMTVLLATQADGIRIDAALPIARVIKRLAHETPEGFGNFRFAMLACVAAGCPFFPSAYHEGDSSLSLGLQGASLVKDAVLQGVRERGMLDVARISARLTEYAGPIVALGKQLAEEQELVFGGVDLSPAPLGEDSIVAAMEASGYGLVGAPGTLAIAAALTRALKHTELPTCGYCGLMLPVLEDAELGKRWAEGLVNAHQLLLYSAVCGTGLDTIPLPGDRDEKEIAALLLDVATLAVRLNKPLSARLFPVPGKKAGEATTFTSPYLTNTIIG